MSDDPSIEGILDELLAGNLERDEAASLIHGYIDVFRENLRHHYTAAALTGMLANSQMGHHTTVEQAASWGNSMLHHVSFRDDDK